MNRVPLALALLAVASFACSSDLEPIRGCEDVGRIHPICGFQSPEDLALLPDGRTVVLSQFGQMVDAKPGSLAFFDPETEVMRGAWRGQDVGPDERTPPSAGWGDSDCPGAPDARFSPHGIDLAPRPDGLLRLLVVNHGGRESVEMFELTGAGDAAALAWRGCAIAPEDATLNDVVALPDGGFLVTKIMDGAHETRDLIKGILGMATGEVFEWQPDSDFAPVPGTEGPFPNGIEVSEDGSEIYLNLYVGGEVRRIVRATGELLASAEVQQPDNSTWGRDGRLLVASHQASLGDHRACAELPEATACGFGFEIVALDPLTLEREVVFANQGPPMGAATVALDLGDELLMGSFASDRLIRAPRR